MNAAFCKIVPVIILVCALNYAYVNVINYTSLRYKLEVAENYNVTLYSRIISTEGYTPDKKIVYCGYEFQNVPENRWDIGDLKYSGANIDVNVWSKYRFMNLYLGKSVKIIKDEKGTEKYKDILDQMEVYPGYGSIRIVGDEVLVKIAE